MISESFPDIFTAQIKIGEGIATAIIKLVNNAHENRSQHFQRQARNKVSLVGGFRYHRPDQIGKQVNDY